MKKTILTLGLMTITTLCATDFSTMSMEELNAMRGSVSVEERDAFRAEMQNRLQTMTPEERQQYISERKKQSNGKGQGSMQRLRDGSGGGMMRKGGGKR